jgi:hypothetical protein
MAHLKVTRAYRAPLIKGSLGAIEHRDSSRFKRKPIISMPTNLQAYDLADAARVVQQALTPVFLLSGVAALLNVFASRLARVADQADALANLPKDAIRDTRLVILKRRSRALDVAVVLAALAGAATCSAVLVLFLGGVEGASGATALFAAFGSAIVLTMGSIVAFVIEMLLAARGVRLTVDRNAGQPIDKIQPEPGSQR